MSDDEAFTQAFSKGNGMKSAWDWLSGKKRAIATVAGIALAWAWKYQVMPEMWLDLGNGLLTAFGGLAITHAAVKASKDK